MSGSDPQSGRVQLGVRFAVDSVLDTSTMKSPVNTGFCTAQAQNAQNAPQSMRFL